MDSLTLSRASGAAAVLYVVAVLGFFAIAIGGTEAFEAEGTRELLPALDRDRDAIQVALWLFIAAPLLLAFSGPGLAYALRESGSLVWVGALAFVGGGFAVVYRAFVFLAMTLELAPAYVAADAQAQETLLVVGAYLDSFAAGADMLGAVLIPGIGVPVFSLAILKTGFARAGSSGWACPRRYSGAGSLCLYRFRT